MVEESIYESFVSALQKKIESITLGNGLEEKTQMGPLISAEHLAKVQVVVPTQHPGLCQLSIDINFHNFAPVLEP